MVVGETEGDDGVTERHKQQDVLAKFYGREREVMWLQQLFEDVADTDDKGNSRAGSKMAVLVADPGVGKSRIVQELYHRLTVSSRWALQQ
jgi:hypothetical protein